MAKDFLEIFSEDGGMPAAMHERALKVQNFNEKLEKFIGLVTNKDQYTSHKREYLIKEAATTSDFPILFGTILERSLLAKYQIAKPDWRQYIATGTQRDFRPADAIGIYGLQGQLPAVRQRSEYKADAKLGEGHVQISLAKYGRMFGMGWESLINDDLGAFADIAERLANAAIRTEFWKATGLIAQSTGPNTTLFGATITHPIDGKAVTNLGALPFSLDNIGTTVTAMRQQKDADGEPILFDGFELVVPPALEIEMMKALNPASLIAAGTAGSQLLRTSANVVANLNISGHVNPYLPLVDVSAKKDATWYMFGKLSSGAASKLNFLRGHENPEIVMKAPNKMSLGGGNTDPMDGNFEEDTMWWRVRHILGGANYDPRFAYAQTGS